MILLFFLSPVFSMFFHCYFLTTTLSFIPETIQFSDFPLENVFHITKSAKKSNLISKMADAGMVS